MCAELGKEYGHRLRSGDFVVESGVVAEVAQPGTHLEHFFDLWNLFCTPFFSSEHREGLIKILSDPYYSITITPLKALFYLFETFSDIEDKHRRLIQQI